MEEFKTAIQALAERIVPVLDTLQTEEATKTAIVLPFISALGYNIFDPSVVTPELNADIGIKKGEKVDYAILQNGKPILIIECKHWKQKLTAAQGSQLFRYFTSTPCKFALLTNGVDFNFYSDFDSANVMDSEPFFQFRLDTLSDSDLDFLEWFHINYYDTGRVLAAAKQRKYEGLFAAYLQRVLHTPDEAFTKSIIAQVYKGKMTEKAIRELSPIVHSTLKNIIG